MQDHICSQAHDSGTVCNTCIIIIIVTILMIDDNDIINNHNIKVIINAVVCFAMSCVCRRNSDLPSHLCILRITEEEDRETEEEDRETEAEAYAGA